MLGIDRRHHRAQERPVAMIGAARIAPAAGEAEAVLLRHELSARHERGRHQRAGVVAPHVLRRAVVIERDEPGMDADHAIDPCGREAALGKRHQHVEINRGVHLVAAPALRLEDAEEARLLHLGDGFLGQEALRLGLGRARGQARDHVARAAQHFLGFGHGNAGCIHAAELYAPSGTGVNAADGLTASPPWRRSCRWRACRTGSSAGRARRSRAAAPAPSRPCRPAGSRGCRNWRSRTWHK